MKAITIKQPWATLIALGEKKFETRSWQTKYRGKLAIHAGKTIDFKAFHSPKMNQVLEKHNIVTVQQLPLGAVIAIARLTDCFKVIEDQHAFAKTTGDMINKYEYSFGDYSEGRYAWKLSDVEHLPKPIPAKGKLGLWEFII